MEQRQSKRKLLSYNMQVHHQQNGQLIGRVVDLTEEGMMLFGSLLIPVGSEMPVVLDLPFEVEGNEFLKCWIKCVRCAPDVNPEFYNLGFVLAPDQMDNTSLIQAVIERYGSPGISDFSDEED